MQQNHFVSSLNKTFKIETQPNFTVSWGEDFLQCLDNIIGEARKLYRKYLDQNFHLVEISSKILMSNDSPIFY